MNRLLVVAALGLAACAHPDPRCAPSAPSTLELRDGKGTLLLADKNGALCNVQHKAVGAVEIGADSVTLKDAGGTTRMILKSTGATTATGADSHGAVRVKLYRDEVQARVLRPDGVPLGSMVRNGDSARVYDPASVPVMVVEPRDHDLVLRDAEGVVRNFIVPGKDARAAGVFAMGSLDPAEQLSVFLYWQR